MPQGDGSRRRRRSSSAASSNIRPNQVRVSRSAPWITNCPLVLEALKTGCAGAAGAAGAPAVGSGAEARIPGDPPGVTKAGAAGLALGRDSAGGLSSIGTLNGGACWASADATNARLARAGRNVERRRGSMAGNRGSESRVEHHLVLREADLRQLEQGLDLGLAGTGQFLESRNERRQHGARHLQPSVSAT